MRNALSGSKGTLAAIIAMLAWACPGVGQAQTQTFTTPGSWTYTVPAGVYYVTATVNGGGGGGGGYDANGRGGNGGSGKQVTAYIRVNPGDVLSGTVAGGGAGGASPRGANRCTGGGLGGTGAAAGGIGGHQSCTSGYSGGGGGGGGATSLAISGTVVLVAGGGGGGGGGGWNNPATPNAESATILASAGTCSAVAGSKGVDAPGDGGGGGGGGAGLTGGAGGNFGADNTAAVPSTGGGAGGSCYVASRVILNAEGAGGAGGTGASTYALGGAGGNGSVVLTPTVATLSLVKSKVSGNNSAVTVTFSSTNLATTPAPATSGTADNTLGTATAPVVIGNVTSNVTVTESSFDKADYSLASATCTDSSTNTSFTPTVSGNTITIAPANMAPASVITCTLRNAQADQRPQVVIEKQSVGGTGTFDFTLANLNNSSNNAVTSLQLNTGTANPAQSQTLRWSDNGSAVTITEAAVAGYTTSYVCTNATAGPTQTPRIPASGTGAGNTATIPVSALAAKAYWTCRFTNTKPRTLTVTKALAPAADNGSFVMTANGTAGTAGGNGATASSSTAAVGSTVLFSEAASGSTSLANYTSAIACVQTASPTFAVAFTAGADNQSGSLVMPDADVTCTITNTRKPVQLRLAKAWGTGPHTGVTASIGATTGLNPNTNAFNAAGGTAATSSSVTAYAGQVATLPAETMSGALIANYSVALACDNGVVPSGTNGAASNTITIPSTLPSNTTVTCTYTNTRKTATLTLAKVVNNTTGGTATTADFTLTATGPVTISGTHGAAPITNATVSAGTYTLSETNVANYTASAWTCSNGVTVNDSRQIALAGGDSTTCTITNAFTNAADLSVTKTNSQTSVVRGGTTDYSIVVTNNGPANANGATFRDTPSSGLSNCSVTACSATPATGVTCPAVGSTIASPGGTAFTLTNFPAGASITMTVRCTVP